MFTVRVAVTSTVVQRTGISQQALEAYAEHCKRLRRHARDAFSI
jgi:hypothetical protein